MNYELAFVYSLALTVLIETICAGALKFYFGRRLTLSMSYLKLLPTVATASLLTLPYLWFLFPAFLKGNLYMILSEMFALIIEAIFYRIFLLKNLKSAFLLSLITNALSFFIGNIIL